MLERMFRNSSDVKFHELFVKHMANTVACSSSLLELFRDPAENRALADTVKEFEHAGDGYAKEVYTLINNVFITKIDKEHIVRLIMSMDDAIDTMTDAALLTKVYHIFAPRPEAIELSKIISAISSEVLKLVQIMMKPDARELEELLKSIKELEEKADVILRNALDLLDTDTAVTDRLFIKWKDIFKKLEEATDHCEDVADVISAITRKL